MSLTNFSHNANYTEFFDKDGQPIDPIYHLLTLTGTQDDSKPFPSAFGGAFPFLSEDGETLNMILLNNPSNHWTKFFGFASVGELKLFLGGVIKGLHQVLDNMKHEVISKEAAVALMPKRAEPEEIPQLPRRGRPRKSESTARPAAESSRKRSPYVYSKSEPTYDDDLDELLPNPPTDVKPPVGKDAQRIRNGGAVPSPATHESARTLADGTMIIRGKEGQDVRYSTQAQQYVLDAKYDELSMGQLLALCLRRGCANSRSTTDDVVNRLKKDDAKNGGARAVDWVKTDATG